MSNHFNAYFLALMIALGSLLSGSVSASPTSNDIPQTPELSARGGESGLRRNGCFGFRCGSLRALRRFPIHPSDCTAMMNIESAKRLAEDFPIVNSIFIRYPRRC